ncbi:MAG TPA: HAD-IA family hydrolase [Longimicrobiales bacterium]|nr:HAD-IA family hydrolase [Longimicrobiales bacterium]
MKPARAVLFDLDGTLIGTRALYLEAYRTAIRPYICRDLSDGDIMALRPTSELGFLRAVVPGITLEACVRDFHAAYAALHAELFEGPYDGILELLDEIRAAGLATGIVTGKSRRSWETTSALCRLGPFQVLVFDDDVRAPKPDPHGLELAIDRLGLEAADCVYIGDTVTDVRAARAAGLRPVAALWARSPDQREGYAARAAAEGAEVVETPGDLRPVLGLDR